MAEESRAEMRVELVGLRAENLRLRKLRAEDRQYAEDRVEIAVALAKNVDTADLEHQVAALQKMLAESDQIVNRVCFYIMKRETTDDEV